MTDAPKAKVSRRLYAELFGISFLVLFFELACIRWFGSYVVFLTFFSNIVLLASFVGMSVGCLAASRKINFINFAPLLLLIAVCSALVLLWWYKTDHGVAVDVGHQYAPDRVYFGTGYRHADPKKVGIPIQVIGGHFFILITLAFVGLGQALGRRFDAIPNRVLAYTTNILGSLVGILAFGAVSFLWLSPFWWFLIGLGGCCFFLSRTRWQLLLNGGAAALTILLVGLAGWGWLYRLAGEAAGEREVFWSPYYRVDFKPTDKEIAVNNIGHQSMISRGAEGLAYGLPYLLNRDSGGQPIEEALIIGAGSGNDIAVALWSGAERVDAVEIDPVIQRLGKQHHPNKPYADRRVEPYLNDGRNFLKQTDRKYDLIVYALVDSLILHSGYSSIRLENFLFTEQAFNEVKARLKPNGMFVMYNFYRQGWIIDRLHRMAKKTFGKEPLVISLPHRERIDPGSTQGAHTMILVGATEHLATAFETRGPYWMPKRNFLDPNRPVGFGVTPPPEEMDPEDPKWERIAPSTVVASDAGALLPSDAWPMLYLKKKIPALNLWGIGIIGGLSLVVLLLFAPRKRGRFNWTLFFLGAGFMLLETKSVVHLALLFGSTWLVNSFVFFAILVMILLSNLFVIAFKPKRTTGWYILLVASLVANVFISLDLFLGQPDLIKIGGSCLLVFIPIFFAGIIFATLFRDSTQPDLDFGANIAGVVLGGLSENLSLVLGFQHLLWVAVLFYLLARLLQRRPLAA